MGFHCGGPTPEFKTGQECEIGWERDELPNFGTDARALESCEAICRGDEAAFTSFYQEWLSTLTAWSLEFVRSDESLALDIVQDTMIRVIRSIPILQDHAALV